MKEQNFGDSVAIAGNTILVGAVTPSNPGQTAGRRANKFELNLDDIDGE